MPKETTVAESPDWALNLEPYDYRQMPWQPCYCLSTCKACHAVFMYAFFLGYKVMMARQKISVYQCVVMDLDGLLGFRQKPPFRILLKNSEG